jgi:hypothetical protein
MSLRSSVTFTLLMLIATGALAATAPVVDSFTASPAAPRPGERVTFRVLAHDPDCGAPPCTTGCGAIIRSDLVAWSDDSGRPAGAFGTSVNDASASPWNGSITWLAPDGEGTYTVRLSLPDNGGMLCGGRQTRVASLQIAVSNVQPPVIDSFEVTPVSVPVGGTATLSVAAHDAAGRTLTYAFSADAGSVTQPSPSSTTATWTAPQIAGPITVRCTVYADGGAPVAAQATATVQLGSYLRTLSTANLRATRVAALPDGRVAAVDGANGLLTVMTTGGGVSWTRSGLETPVAIAIVENELYVMERRATRVSVWSASGDRLRAFSISAATAGQLAAGPRPGELSLSDIGAARISVISAVDGSPIRTVGDGLLKAPSGLATHNGRIAVADAAAARVYIFDDSGAITTIVGNETAFVRPQGLTWDAANARLVAADSYSGELTIFGDDGTLLGTLGGFGTGGGQLVNPIDVTLLAGGVVAVTTADGAVPLYQTLATLRPVAAPGDVIAADRANDDGGAIAVSWTRSSDDPGRVTAYRIERAEENDDRFEVAGTAAPGTATFIDQSLPDARCRRYRVVATDGAADAESEPSPCVAARNDLAPPAPPFILASSDTPTSATIEWGAAGATDLHSYAIEVSSSASVPFVSSVPAGITSMAFGDLVPDTSYTVAVRAIDSASNASIAATSAFRTLPNEPPSPPVSVTAIDARTGGTIDVSWSSAPSDVAVAKYRVTCTPSVDGWPAVDLETLATTARIESLVNDLPCFVTVVAIGINGLESEPSSSASVTPTSAARALPVVEATSPVEDAAGLAVDFPYDRDKRTIRFQYRSTSTELQPRIDGAPFGAPLAESAGVWTDGAIDLDHKSLAPGTHRLELRSTAFPDPSARLELRNIDFVPLAPSKVDALAFNSVVDIVWEWPDARRDLSIALVRDAAPVPCAFPQTTRCRAVSLENEKKHTWSLAIVSPAGWIGVAGEVFAGAKYADTPPPVTDLTIENAGSTWLLNWTPLTSAVTRQSSPQPVVLYRVYAAGSLVAEATAPPVTLPVAVDPLSVIVRSVDATGRESQ